MRVLLPVFTCLLLLAAGCVESTIVEKPEAQKSADPRIFDFRKELNDDPTKCAHAFEAIGTHSYQRMMNGIPMTHLCTITRCQKCGEVRHECQKRKRKDDRKRNRAR